MLFLHHRVSFSAGLGSKLVNVAGPLVKSLFRQVQWRPLVEKHCPTTLTQDSFTMLSTRCRYTQRNTSCSAHTHTPDHCSEQVKNIDDVTSSRLLMSSALLSEHPLRVKMSNFFHLMILRQINVYLFQALVASHTSGCCVHMEITPSYTVTMVSDQWQIKKIWNLRTDHTGVSADWTFQPKN